MILKLRFSLTLKSLKLGDFLNYLQHKSQKFSKVEVEHLWDEHLDISQHVNIRSRLLQNQNISQLQTGCSHVAASSSLLQAGFPEPLRDVHGGSEPRRSGSDTGQEHGCTI
ncbi:hypothetical protein GOODEAATRI_033650 [Goodea atripinnis]|uniref:Uncharacterized protein n=1 Tax=Goodea atripinnis TaxID=208336 RepID=A0ABV0P9U9_9TELE